MGLAVTATVASLERELRRERFRYVYSSPLSLGREFSGVRVYLSPDDAVSAQVHTHPVMTGPCFACMFIERGAPAGDSSTGPPRGAHLFRDAPSLMRTLRCLAAINE